MYCGKSSPRSKRSFNLAQNNIKSIECVEYPELGMEAIWKIEVEDFPAFILVDDKGNDFFKQLKPWNCSK